MCRGWWMLGRQEVCEWCGGVCRHPALYRVISVDPSIHNAEWNFRSRNIYQDFQLPSKTTNECWGPSILGVPPSIHSILLSP